MERRYKVYNFTLFEILIAVTVIAICFVVMLNALALNIKNTAISNGYITACFLTNSKMADILNQDKYEEATSEGDFGEDFSDYKWTLKTTKLEDKDQEETDLYKLELDILFAKGDNQRKLKVETVVYSQKPKEQNDDGADKNTNDTNDTNDTNSNNNHQS
jgi:hypothetical protein